jgi:hypothetical protein
MKQYSLWIEVPAIPGGTYIGTFDSREEAWEHASELGIHKDDVFIEEEEEQSCSP